MAGEIVKVTTKGQITLPARIRQRLRIGDDSHLYVAEVGNLIVMKRVDELSLDDITRILSTVAEEKGITREMIEKEVEAQRSRLHSELRK